MENINHPEVMVPIGQCQAHEELVTEVRELVAVVRASTVNVDWMIRLGQWAVALAAGVILISLGFGAHLVIKTQNIQSQMDKNTVKIDYLWDRAHK